MPNRPPVHRPILGDPRGAERDRDRRRGTPPERGYDHAWRKFRVWVLAARPLCEDCLASGRAVPAVDVHHVAKIRDAPGRRLDPANVMALCHECHAVRTNRGE